MAIFSRKKEERYEPKKKIFFRKRWFKLLTIIVFLLVATGGWAMYKTGSTLSKISTKDGFFRSLWKSIPGVGSDQLQGEEEGQVNVLLLGMRGDNMPGGGLLADTIMVVMARPKENKVALVSIPRDLWVKHPDSSTQSKINSIHALYEERGEGKGMDAMKQVVGEITGIPIHYAVRIDFNGFKELVDTVGGIDVYLDKPFSEPTQFEGESALDFSLPAGKNHIDGQKALFFVRARYASSDFERARRQQMVLLALKDKMLSLGTLADFGKVNNILNVLGEDVRTDMDISEMKKFFDLANDAQNPQITQKVFDTSDEGLLYSSKADTPDGKTYILLPTGGNYDKIQEAIRNIFQPKDSQPAN
jgi:polyisoprenyl-teichoic acid--peptidoglycan teichoic acid transferase